MTELQRAAGGHSWQLGRYRFAYRSDGRRFHRWSCDDGMRGVGNYASPLTAWLAQRRWARQPSRPCE